MDLAEIFERLPSLTPNDRTLVEDAYEFASRAHADQFRNSGEPYIAHPFRVCMILADMHMDAPTIAAGFLHDTIEDCEWVTVDVVEQSFGQEVALLVHGVTKMKQLPTKANENPGHRRSVNDRQAEYLRQIFMAMGNDVRVILIKLADRLDNMRTLGALPPERQQKNAQETMDIFAPMANRLGIGHLKWQLEDLAFRYLEPEKYREIAMSLDERRISREDNLNTMIKRVSETLQATGIKAQVQGRPKHIYSIYRKMNRKQVPFDQIFDIRAVRVLVDDIPTCYQVLGVIHNTWRPVPGEFDDYIATPKENGYRSLHTAITDDDGRTLEVQIRTLEMHQDSEFGIAAHWKYKESGRHTDIAYEQRLNYMRRLLENVHSEEQDAEEFVEAIKQSIAGERIYVFTPRNDIIDLPEGATPIDFAYHIHTEVGHRCRGAKINGKMVSLDHALETGDRCEVITTKRGGPSLDWLNADLGYVKTQRARQKIRHWFRKLDREKNINLGRDALEHELKRLGMEDHLRSEIAQRAGYPSLEHMLAAIGYGDVTAASIVSRVVQLEKQAEEARRDELVASPPSPQRSRTADQGIDIAGTSGLLVKLAQCCNPAPGDAIIGFITRTGGVTVHRRDCTNIVNTNEPERLIQVSWGRAETSVYPVPVEIRARDREGLMRDIGAVIAGENVNMTNVNINLSDNHIAIFRLVMEVSHVGQLSRVLNKIDMLPEVVNVRRLQTVDKTEALQ
ncbi:MAG: bifunctional (p)ppGpp synthetase/guanosine-3',5'-bis(diphosphate) 3'-pyrophosphohydrolase [Chloroflexi bacterium]|nr:bifunctional (p)ppGpp synthetase/guanosine-3',5'-bis(diphosphate) 3'-pyrophosphohydrolase [Chloroflexota bacterium]